jgi:signal transduction histidine kinase
VRPLHRSLWSRLLVSHLVAVVAVVLTLVIAVRLLVPRLFDDQVGAGGRGQGARPPDQAGQFRDLVVLSLNRALVVAAVGGLVVGAVLALLLARRIVRPIDRVRATTRALAQGHLHERVTRPDDVELAALADDVNVLAEHLERTESRRRQLVTDLGHELRTPITTIQGYVEGFQDGVIPTTPESFAELADEVRRLERLTADLGLLSRLDEGQVALTRSRVDLGMVARQVVGRLQPQLDASELSVVADGPDGLWVDADPDRLVQVLVNLLGNAIRYSPPGATVAVRWSRSGGWAECGVADTGPGIPPDELSVVFDRFVRGSAAAGTPGTGVGLTIARSLARAHGGDVVASSAGLGRGSTFTLRLPAAP